MMGKIEKDLIVHGNHCILVPIPSRLRKNGMIRRNLSTGKLSNFLKELRPLI
jgi:hypothetical protein